MPPNTLLFMKSHFLMWINDVQIVVVLRDLTLHMLGALPGAGDTK